MSTKSKKQQRRINHTVILYMEEIGARIVAQSGIPSDRFHLGKLIFQGLKDDPDFVLQTDGAVHKSETSRSVLARSVQCAVALKNIGLKHGDVMVIMAPNHLNLAIPFYAALYTGVVISGTDHTLGTKELKSSFDVTKPKIVFCQQEKSSNVEEALKQLGLDAHIITFDAGPKFTSFSDFLKKNSTDEEVKDFKPSDFNAEVSKAFLTATSGTTGLPKAAILTHKNITLGLPQFEARFFEIPRPNRIDLLVSPIQWITAGYKFSMAPILKFTRLQTSAPITKDNVYDVINTYKPTTTVMSPNLMSSLMTEGDRDRCDFSSFEDILLGGNLVTQSLIDTVQSVVPHAHIEIAYGMSETSGKAMSRDDDAPPGSVGRPLGYLQYRLVDVSTLEDILEPNVTGELWMKGPTIFEGYYNNVEATKDVFAEDGWFKSGDLFYRDKYNNYMYVDRLKTLLKYRTHQISPAEVEEVIRTHPGVHDVVVVGIPDEECGDLPAAVVVRRQGQSVTASEIKNLVKESLTDSKHLRGGVVFLSELPLMATTKVDRMKLKKMVIEMERE